jgi:GT2 family glycosyltransferase
VSESPTVSIIVVTWRDRDRVLECLQSIGEHVAVPHEVIVVDDGSGDGTPAAVRERFPAAVMVARPTNGGLVAGRNDGLKLAGGRYVLMLDSDTRVRPGAVETLATVLDENPQVGLVGPKLIGENGELQLSCRRWPPFLIPFIRRGPYPKLIDDDPPVHRRHLMKDFDHAARRPVVWVSGAAQMWRRELADRLGAYDRRISSYGGEDLDWCLRVWAAGLEVQYEPAAEIVHAWQAVTRQNLYSRKSFRALADWYYIQAKHRRLRDDPRLAEANA